MKMLRLLSVLLLVGAIQMSLNAFADRFKDSELPGVDADQVQTQSQGGEESEEEPGPIKHWYYDYRSSQKYCMTVEEARKERIPAQNAGKVCK